MTSTLGSNGFAAKLLESSARALGAYAAEKLLEDDPSVTERSGEQPFEHWKAQLEGRVLDLANSLEAGEPILFQANLEWQRNILGDDPEIVGDLFSGLEALKQVIGEEMPASVSGAATLVLDDAPRHPRPSSIGRALSAQSLRPSRSPMPCVTSSCYFRDSETPPSIGWKASQTTACRC